MVTAAEQDAQVLAVLRAAGEPLLPGEIARRIDQPWCVFAGRALRTRIFPALRRISALRHQGGEWTAPASPSPEVK